MLTIIEVTDSSGPLEWMLFLMAKYWNMFLRGTWMTLYVAVVGTILGFLLGYLIGIIQDLKVNKQDGVLKRLAIPIGKGISIVYVELFRGTPMIVQGMIVYYGLRQCGINISSIAAGIIVTVLNTGAYMAETVRAGMNSIDPGQREGALAMGMSPIAAIFYVILPQAFKNITPEMCNTFLTNLKMTSVLNVIGVSELFLVAKTAGGTYYKYFESYLVIAVIYFILCFVINRIFLYIEKKMNGSKAYALAIEYMESD